MVKKYYWLKLNSDYFSNKVIKKLRKIAGGDTYTIIYLKLQLLSLQNEGRLYYDGLEDTFAEEMALTIDEEPENVKITLLFLAKHGLIEGNGKEYILPETLIMMGSESESAERVRRFRESKGLKALHCNGDVTKGNTEIEIDTEKESEIEKEKHEGVAIAPLLSDLPSDTKEESKKTTKAPAEGDIEKVYETYPSKCPVSDPPRSTSKSPKDKLRIARRLSNGYKAQELTDIILEYVEQCKRSRTYIKNFSTFLNNIPDIKALREVLPANARDAPPGSESESDEIVRLALEKLEREGVDVSKYRSD